jgi:hypothetical protein
VRTPRKDTEERKSRVTRSRPILVVGVALVGGGIVAAFLKDVGVAVTLIVLGVFVLLLWMVFPYLQGQIELSLSGKGFRAGFRGVLTDPVTGVAEANDEPTDPPAPPPGRLRKLIRWRPRSKGSAEG